MFSDKEQKQLEFFEELSKDISSKKFRGFKFPVTGDEKIILKVSYEKMILAVIAFVLVLTLVFSLGVERGRNSKQPLLVQQKEIFEETESVAEPPVKEVNNVVHLPAVEKEASQKSRETKKNDAKKTFYTVQVVAYKNASKAKEEKKNIEKSGVKSFIIKGENYFLVCAGDFNEIDSAKKQVMMLKKTYRDCFVKKVKQEDLYRDE
ncbi:MAG: SPOR domain-containing protein [Candidatus Omnitrophota bacterium]